MYKLYTISYVDAGTEQYFCKVVEASDNPEELKTIYEQNKDHEDVEVVEFKIEGFEIEVKQVNK